MILRVSIRNLYSFKEQTDFNLFPNRSNNLDHHKIEHNGIEVLRLSAIYGANGSGKSNLVKAISLIDKIVEKGKIPANADDLKFKLADSSKSEPSSIAIEFYCHHHIYYYAVSFDGKKIVYEYFAESRNKEDILIFERAFDNGKQQINFFPEYLKDDKNKLFKEILEEKLISNEEVLLSFLSDKYGNEFIDIRNAVDWFRKSLVVISPDSKHGMIAYTLEKNKELKKFAEELLPGLNTGVTGFEVDTKPYLEAPIAEGEKAFVELIQERFSDREELAVPLLDMGGGDRGRCVVKEDGNVNIKTLITHHKTINGELVPFNTWLESDGTQRLIDYLPALYSIVHKQKVYVIDEIERSIHPLTIKEILRKISHDPKAQGQLIFTTHESSLLDQDILRTDEIWFAQKDVDGSSKIYSLSDFKVHHTINIENGYLNGRYGGIPFLSHLRDINWHRDEVSKEE